ncbi:MAG: S41 family peptidase [Candidatus Hodarchaeota archaeon]
MVLLPQEIPNLDARGEVPNPAPSGVPLGAHLVRCLDFSKLLIKHGRYYPDLLSYFSCYVHLTSTKLYPEDKVGYLQIGSMANPSDYHSQIMSFYQSIADYNHLIIDIRGNAGGNDNFWLEEIVFPLLKEQTDLSVYYAFNDKAIYSHKFRELNNVTEIVSKADFDYLPPETLSDDVKIYNKSYSIPVQPNTVAFNGSISVLTDKIIYSSSETFAAFCKITGFAKLYGTSTGGDGIGDKTYFTLPNSKLVICFSYILGLFPSGYANEEIHTPPDVYYESSAGNWTELIDFTIKNITKSPQESPVHSGQG